VPAGHLTAVITFPDLDLFGMPAEIKVCLDPHASRSTHGLRAA